MELCSLTAAEMRKLLDKKEIGSVELVKAHLERIETVDPKLGAFLEVNSELAIASAESAQKRIDEKSSAPLTGIPVALKDNMVTKGLRTTCASKILENWVPPYDGTAVQKLINDDAIVIGKTNLDEFAMGSSTERSAFFPTKNPWNLNCVPGGSSGGSAVAVAAGLAPISFGSDTGGSIRQPASLCGVVGFKPTYGRVSRYGLIAFSSSLDQIGPFSRSVEDAIFGFETVMGHDPLDSTTVQMHYDGSLAREKVLKGKRVALPKQLFSSSVSKEVLDCVKSSIELLTRHDVIFEEVDLPMIEYGVATYYIIAPAEASSNLARFDGVRYGLRVEEKSPNEMMKSTRTVGFGKEVQERLIIGTYVLSSGYYDAFYNKAHQARTLMKRQFQETFGKFDFVMSPTSPSVAFEIGSQVDDPIALKQADYCTIPANMGGFPAISLNCGSHNGLPIGLQIMSNSFTEENLFGFALGVEELMPEMKIPPL